MNLPNLPREVVRTMVEAAYYGTSLEVDECFYDVWVDARVMRISFASRPDALAWSVAAVRARRVKRYLETETGLTWLVVVYRDKLPIRAAVNAIERMAYRFGREG